MTNELKPWERMSPERWRKLAVNRGLPAIIDTPEARARLIPVIERALERMKQKRAGK